MTVKFNGISLRNMVMFKKTDLGLDKPGITVVRGLNRDSSVENSNGAGKSLLFNAISAVFYDNLPTANRRKMAKDLFKEQGELTLSFSVDKKEVVVTKTLRNGSVKTSISCNDEDMRFRTQAASQSWLTQLVPISEELFYQLVYLRGSSANVLLNGTGTNKHTFFEKLFNLEDYDYVAQQLRSRLKLLNTTKIQYDTIEDSLPEDLEPIDRGESRLKKLNRAARKLQKELNTLQKQLTEAVKWEEAIGQLPSKYRDRLDDIQGVYNKAERKYRRLVYQDTVWNEYRVKIVEYRKYKEQRSYLKRKVDKYRSIVIQDTTKARDSLHRELHRKLIMLDKYKALTDNANTKAAVTDKARKVRLKLATIVWQLRQLHSHICPVCGSTVDADLKTKVSEQLSKTKEDYRKLWLECVEEDKEAADKWYLSFDLDKELLSIEKLKKQLVKLDKLEEYSNRKAVYEEQLKGLKKVAKPVDKKPSPVDKDKLEKARILAGEYRHYLQIADRLMKMTRPSLRGEKLQAKITDIRDKWEQIQIEQQTVHQEVGQLKEQHRIYNSGMKKLKYMRKELKDYDLITALVEAYGPKGLRSYDVEELVGLYVSNLNQYSSLVFSEAVSFSFELGNRTLSLYANRATHSCDICYLSGAERQAFNLLSFLSIFPLIPKQYRTSLLVLDEVDSAMSPQNRQLLATELLPRLQQLVPSIFIITPHSEKEFYVPNASTLLVTRENAQSRLESIDGI